MWVQTVISSILTVIARYFDVSYSYIKFNILEISVYRTSDMCELGCVLNDAAIVFAHTLLTDE